MSSSPGSGGGSSPTVWTSATNKSRSGSRTAGWRRRDSCWGSKLWPTFRDAAEGESIGSKSQAFYAPLGLLSMHALIYPSFTLQAIITTFSDFFYLNGAGYTSPKTKPLSGIQSYILHVRKTFFLYNRTKKLWECVFCVGCISRFCWFVKRSVYTLNVSQAKHVAKAVVQFGMTQNDSILLVPFLVRENEEGVGPLGKISKK